MLTWSWIALILILAAPLLRAAWRKWILAPLRVHRDNTLPYESRSLPGGRERLAPETAATFDTLLLQFHAEGFDEVTFSFTQPSYAPDVTGVHAFLVNRRDRQMASLIATARESSSVRKTVISVGCLFEDGSSFCTAIRQSPQPFPPDPADDRVTAHWIRDVHTLCEFHRRRLAASTRADAPRVVPPPGGELAFLAGEWSRVRDRLLATRFARHEPGADHLRFTWKGAFLFAWRLTDPVRVHRAAAEGRRALLAWRDLDMASYVSPVTPPPRAALPTDDVATNAPSEPAPTRLRYEMILAPGEIAEESIPPDTLAVRMGMPGKWRYLATRWPAILWIAALAVATTYWAAKLEPTVTGPPGAGAARFNVLLPITTFFVAVFTAAKLTLQVLAVRGTILLTASPRGLTYRNVPFLDGRGAVTRDDIFALMVLPYPDPVRKDLHTLFLVTKDGGRLPLLITPDRDRLQCLRARLAQTMGIDLAPTTSSSH